MFTCTRSERKWVRETTLYPPSFPLLYCNKKESQISLELFCGAYGPRNRLAALLAKNPDPGSRGKYIQKKKKPCGFFLRCVRDSNP